MKILFLCSRLDLSGKAPWLTNELVEQFRKEGDIIDICFYDWSCKNKKQVIQTENSDEVIVVQPKTNKFGKIYKWLIEPFFSIGYFRKKIVRDGYDLIIFFSPAITLGFINFFFKRKYNCKSLFILWDFFPYHHYQIGLIPRVLLYPFSIIEKICIYSSDIVGLMSKKNIEYFNNKYSSYSGVKCHVPIWGGGAVYVKNIDNEMSVRNKYGICDNDFICVFGGQLEPGRGIEHILEIKRKISNENIKFFIIGSGSLKSEIEIKIKKEGMKNVFMYDLVPREDYLFLLSLSHIGLVVTVENVDVPTFPSKTIDYFRCAKPVIAIVEKSTDYGFFVQDVACAGYSYNHEQINSVAKCIEMLYNSPDLCKTLGNNGAKYYQENLFVENITKKIKNEVFNLN
ncbi:MAG: glycosyltransferase family 4 protein [Aeromonas sp.]